MTDTESAMDELQRLGQEWEAGVTDTERLRRLARDSNDGKLCGPALMAADTIEAMADTITKLRAEVERLRGALTNIAEATSAEDDAGENYRWDDREGALDYAYATARAALTQTKDTTDDAVFKWFDHDELREGELRCGDCGNVNPTWFAPNEIWNLVMGGPDATDDPGGIVCPICFVRRAEAVGITARTWKFEPC